MSEIKIKDANNIMVTEANDYREYITKQVQKIINSRIDATLGCRIGINSEQIFINDKGCCEKVTDDEDIIRKQRNLIVMDAGDDIKLSINSIHTKDVSRSDVVISIPIEELPMSDNTITESKLESADIWDSDKESIQSYDSKVEHNDETTHFKSLRAYIEEVDNIDDMRSMFISMILEFKERVKGCEHCETCSQVIQLVEINIKMAKKVTKLAHGFATVFMHLVDGVIPDKMPEHQINHLNVIFVLLVKNSEFDDVTFVYEKFKRFINVNAFEGIALRLAIQKYKPAEIRKMLLEWGCDPTVREHRPLIRAFYYEKFGIVRTLIELGSSYKYFLQEELAEKEYKTLQAAIDTYLAREMPDATRIEQELRIVGMINDYRHMIIENGDDTSPVSSDYFLEEFTAHFLEVAGIGSKDSETNNGKRKKKKKPKKKKKQNNVLEPVDVPRATIQEESIDSDTFIDIVGVSSSLAEPVINSPEFKSSNPDEDIDLMNDETFADDNQIVTQEEPIIKSQEYGWQSYYQYTDLSKQVERYWDNHFYNILGQYMILS